MVWEFYAHHRDLLGVERPPRGWGREEAERILSDPDSSILVLEEGGEVAGFARVQEHEGAVFLREIYVLSLIHI